MKKCVFRKALAVMIGAGLFLAGASLAQSQEQLPQSGGERGIIVVDGTVGSEKQAPSQATGKGSRPSDRNTAPAWDDGVEKGIEGKAGSGPLKRPRTGAIEPSDSFRPGAGAIEPGDNFRPGAGALEPGDNFRPGSGNLR